jgi:ribosomal protein S7
MNLLAVKLLVSSAKERSERSFAVRLANEILDAFLSKGIAIKKKNELVSECINSRPFLSLKRFGRFKRRKKVIH